MHYKSKFGVMRIPLNTWLRLNVYKQALLFPGVLLKVASPEGRARGTLCLSISDLN